MFFTPSLQVDLLVIAVVGLFVGHSEFVYRNRRWSMLDPLNFFWAGALVIYVLQPLRFYNPLEQWYGEDGIIETLLVVLFGLVWVVLGYESRLASRVGRALPQLPERLVPNRMLVSCAVLIALGCAGWVLEFRSAGGIVSWAGQARGGTDYSAVSGYVRAMSSLLIAGIGLLALHVEMHRRGALLRVFAWAALALALLWMIYLGSRSRTILIVATGLLAWYLPRRKSPSFLLILPAFVALYVVTSFLAEYRLHFTNLSFNTERIDWNEAADLSLPTLFSSEDSQAVQRVSRGIEFSATAAVVDLVPDRVPFNLGMPLLEFFTRPIPRSLWPEKRYPHYEAFTPIYEVGQLTTYWVFDIETPVMAGPAFGFTGHWYAMGGLISLSLAGFVTGALFRAIRTGYYGMPCREGNTVLYLMLCPIGFGEAAGTPLFWLFSLPLLLAPVVLLTLFAKQRALIVQPARFRLAG